MSTSLASRAWGQETSLKGLMTWSVNWNGSKGWTFGGNVKPLQGR
jgi:chitinase